MSQYAAELCKLLITDNFGELYSFFHSYVRTISRTNCGKLIFSYLLHHGRQPLPRIVQNTHLSPRQVRHGLAVLIRQHLVFHCTSFDDGITYYESDWRAAYNLVRSGKIVQFVEKRLGNHAARVISTLLALGHAKVSYLESLPELQPGYNSPGQMNGVNGIYDRKDKTFDGVNSQAKDHTVRKIHSDGSLRDAISRHESDVEPQLQTILQQLASFGFIIRVRNQHFQSLEDNFDTALKAAKSSADTHGLKGKKLEAKLVEDAEKLVKEWTNGTISRALPSVGMLRGVKRRITSNDSSAPKKRMRIEQLVEDEKDEQDDEDDEDDEQLDNELSEDDYSDDHTSPLDVNMVIRVNCEKFNVAFRNRRLIELADQSTTTVTSQVYETLLSRIELQTPRCRDKIEAIPEGEEAEQYSIPVHLHTLSKDLDADLDLVGVIAGITSGISNGFGGDDDGFEEDEPGGPGGARSSGPSRNYLVDQHLSLLAAEPNFFCTRRMQAGMITWAVEYRHLARKLRHLELERLIEARFGSVAVRVVRVLAAKGKLDEKRLQEISLMASKDLRQILGQMASAGFVELQEVPRDAQRQPSRTIYLWFYDPDRVRVMIIEDTYKSMSRCLQRMRAEREKLKHLLEKTERTDVKGNEERYLSVAELQTLKQWRTTETILLGEVAKLDELVAVLRDY
ncbi:RNA polymerase III subunit C82 [Emydomyces testavorans]|uniref:DNA-directed RNA polymerase III subunit RPC3 n=1 Tax=Emydomyces testavorans TaxID=2070801 RepID=A0AAF0DEQ4_9EURO|nr:RNA polymerase III subunit C82 [Emydomyces testavorans]